MTHSFGWSFTGSWRRCPPLGACPSSTRAGAGAELLYARLFRRATPCPNCGGVMCSTGRWRPPKRPSRPGVGRRRARPRAGQLRRPDSHGVWSWTRTVFPAPAGQTGRRCLEERSEPTMDWGLPLAVHWTLRGGIPGCPPRGFGPAAWPPVASRQRPASRPFLVSFDQTDPAGRCRSQAERWPSPRPMRSAYTISLDPFGSTTSVSGYSARVPSGREADGEHRLPVLSGVHVPRHRD